MNIKNFRKLMQRLPTERTRALTSEQIRNVLCGDPRTRDVSELGQRAEMKTVRNYINALRKDNLLMMIPGATKGARFEKYFLRSDALTEFFINSQAAEHAIWKQNIAELLTEDQNPQLGSFGSQKVISNDGRNTLAEFLRIVPDGVGKEFSKTQKPNVVIRVLEAIKQGRMIRMEYKHERKDFTDIVTYESGPFAVLGLVAKDGRVYMINCQSDTDELRHRSLSRVIKMELDEISRIKRRGFSLDAYIKEQHQFSHVLPKMPSPIRMVLKVHPDAIYHFKERPYLSEPEQVIEGPGPDGRFTVTATVPFTMQLPPDLWSHAGWVEVIAPKELRDYVGREIVAAYEHYKDDKFNAS